MNEALWSEIKERTVTEQGHWSAKGEGVDAYIRWQDDEGFELRFKCHATDDKNSVAVNRKGGVLNIESWSENNGMGFISNMPMEVAERLIVELQALVERSPVA